MVKGCDYNSNCLSIKPETPFPVESVQRPEISWNTLNLRNGAGVKDELAKSCRVEGCFPKRIQCDNGREFISKDVDRRAYENQVTLDFSRPGKPTNNPYVESFNGKFRDECLTVNWFLALEDARHKIENFRWEYNHNRPHSALNDLTPKEFVNLQLTKPETPLFIVLTTGRRSTSPETPLFIVLTTGRRSTSPETPLFIVLTTGGGQIALPAM